jgi:hypothetical protein
MSKHVGVMFMEFMLEFFGLDYGVLAWFRVGWHLNKAKKKFPKKVETC